MKSSIIAGLPAEEAAEITAEFLGCAKLRERIAYLLTNKIDAKRSVTRAVDAYSVPSWPFLQADAIGYERALSEIISLLLSKSD